MRPGTRRAADPYLRTLGIVILLTSIACGQSHGTASPPGSGAAVAPSASASTADGATPAGLGSLGPNDSAAASPAPSLDLGHLAVGFEPVVDGLRSPLAITNAGDGTRRLFVAEQGGRIR